MSDDLVAFIEARLRAEEAEALAATPGPWRYNPGKQWFTIEDKAVRDAAARAGAQGEEFVGAGPLDATIGVAATGPADHPQSMADARLIARHDPARVLRDVAAKRRLLEEYREAQAYYTANRSAPAGEVQGLWTAVQLLAQPYSDHPGFQPEWLIEENR